MPGTMRSRREVLEHLSGDRIKCLICGKHFKAVCHHARITHGISAREYKERFGLPVTRGVTGETSRGAWSASMHRTHAAGKLHPTAPEPPTARVQPRYTADMHAVDPAEMVTRVSKALKAGATLTKACQQDGVLCWSALHTMLQKDAVLKKRLDAVIEQLPFPQQARMKKLGERFDRAVRERLDMTAKAISDQLGVSEEAVRRTVVRLRAAQEGSPK